MMKNRYWRAFLLALVMSLITNNQARGEIVTIPQSVNIIEDEAFSNCRTITEVYLPDGVTTIGDFAFSNCSALKKVYLSDSLLKIGESAFSNCAEALLFECSPEGEVVKWARTSGFDWNAGTVCRALIIGQTYSGTEFYLNGTENDRISIAGCLSRFGTTGYMITTAADLTNDDIIHSIASVFGEATQDDISFFYYAGHGVEGGCLVGSDLTILEPSRLRSAFDNIQGRKVIVIDACYSGALIRTRGKKKDPAEEAIQFTQSFLESFSGKTRGHLTGSNYFVIAACGEDEESKEGRIYTGNDKRMGYFTYSLCQGLGWDGIYSVAGRMLADINYDGVVTIAEAFNYAYQRALYKNGNQHAMVYPEQCTAFSPFRE